MRRRACTLLTTALLVPGTLAGTLAGAGPAQAADASLFHPYTTYEPRAEAEGVAIGDVTGDGRADVLLTTGSSQTQDTSDTWSLWVYPQAVDGTLGAPAQIRTGAPYGSSMVVNVADLDGDGDLDVLVSTRNGVLAYPQGQGGLGSPTTVPVPEARDLEVADVTGDGVVDLVVNSTKGVAVWKQTPSGPASGVVGFLNADPVTEVETGDVTGDGRVDVVTAHQSVVDVYAQTADGFAPAASYSSGVTGYSTSVNGLAIGDTNGDGLADLHASVGGNRPDSWVVTRLQQSDGTLGAPVQRASYDIPESLEYADVSGDGRGDLVVAHGGWNTLGVYDAVQVPGTAAETRFALPYASHYDPDGVAVGDFSGDGKADVAVADYNNGLVVLRGARPGDDVTAPETTITNGPSGTLRTRAATFSFSSTEPGTFQCSLDQATWASCTSPVTYDGLAVGSHQLRVRATDNAWNTDTSYALRTFSVDGPETTITSGPAATIRATSATLAFTASENGASFQCAFDSTAWSPCASPMTYTGLAPGSRHTFDVRAVATDGRVDTTPATRAFSVESAADLGVAATAAPDPVKKGGTLTWTTQVRNPAAVSATGVRLTQSVPTGVTVTSATTSDSRAGCTVGAGSVGCDVAELAAGATWTVTVRGTVTATKGTLAATATVTTTSWDPNAANDSSATSVKVGNGR